jgi:hypothetical protein
VTAAVQAPELSPAAGEDRAVGRVVELASGLLMLLDEHGITGRLPLDARAQAGRLRHAVKLAVQATAAPSPRSSRPPAPALPDPAVQLQAWIACQPWAQPGPVGWVYLLCFHDPATGEHRPLRGDGCRGQFAGHYWGKPESSGLLKGLWPVSGGEFAELAGLMDARRRPWSSGHQLPSCARRWRSQSLLELDLVPQRDAVAPYWGDFGLQLGSAVVDRAAVQGGQAKAPPLIEAQRVDVVVGSDEPQAGAALLGRQPLNRLDEGGADPTPPLRGVEGEDLALLAVAVQHVGEHAHQAAVLLVLSDERWVVQGVDERIEAGHPRVVTLGKEGLDGWTVGELPRADCHPITLLPRHNGPAGVHESQGGCGIPDERAGIPISRQGSRGSLRACRAGWLSRDNARVGPSNAPRNSRLLQHWTDDLVRRITRQHRNPNWSGPGRLVQVALAAGLTFELAYVEYPATRGRERRLKNQESAYRRCPLCRGTGGPLDPAAAAAVVGQAGGTR